MTERATELKITLAQLNPTVGDVEGNAAKVRAARARAKTDGADLVVLPELFMTGYPPEDLVLKPAFQSACRSATEALARETADGGPAMLIGTPTRIPFTVTGPAAGPRANSRFSSNTP